MAKLNATLIALIALIFMAIFSAGNRAVADDSTTQPSATTDPSVAQDDNGDIPIIDADILLKAFKANEVRADANYAGVLEVIGTVRRIALDTEKRPVVELGGDGTIPAVACIFKPMLMGEDTLAKVKALNVGDRIIIGGTIEGPFYGDVRLQALELRPAPAAGK